MATSEQLEREAEFARSQLADTLAELRAILTPGQVMDQIVDYASGGSAGEFYRNLRQQVVQNPVPVALIGAGLAWMMMGSGMSARRGAQAGEPAETGDGGSRMQGAAATSASLNDAVSGTDRAVSSAYGRVADRTSRAAGTLADSADAARRRAAATSHQVADFMRDQPLVLAGIGLALGAALGALLPSTRAEDRLMGRQSDAAKQQATDLAEESFETMKETAGAALGAHDAKAQPDKIRSATDETPLIPAGTEEQPGKAPDRDRAAAQGQPFGRTTGL